MGRGGAWWRRGAASLQVPPGSRVFSQHCLELREPGAEGSAPGAAFHLLATRAGLVLREEPRYSVGAGVAGELGC